MAGETMMLWGPTTEVINEVAALNDQIFTGAPTQFDNSVLLYPYAMAVFYAPGFSAAPAANETADLFMLKDEVDGVDGEIGTPSGTDQQSALWVGSFVLYDSDLEQRRAINISLQGVNKARFYLQNKAGQTINAGLTVKVTPFTFIPAA